MKQPLMLFIAAALIAASPVGAQHDSATEKYPTRPIKLIVPTTAGSNPDQLARLLGARLTAATGQPVIIDNRPGAGGTIGLNAVATTAPDGYTLGMQTLPFVITPSMISKVPYDTERDLATVTLVNWNYNVLVVPATSPIRSVADLVAHARAKPETLKYSSAGIGTPSHLALALLSNQVSIKLTHVPYKGGPASLAAVLASEVDFAVGGVQTLRPLIAAGKLRALATSAPHRLAVAPDLPTFSELGYTDVSLVDWHGIVAPAGTPKAIIDTLHGHISRVLAQPDMAPQLQSMGMEIAGLAPAEFALYQHREIQKWSKLVRAAGITVD